MVVTCHIEFDKNPQGIYAAGEVASGKITLTADEVKHVKAIQLQINGFAYTNWTESGSGNSSDTTYSGHIDYIKAKSYLIQPSEWAVVLKINGIAHTEWSEDDQSIRSDDSITKSETTYEGHVDYIKAKSYLFEPSKEDGLIIIEPGVHCFSFNCHIPSNCPSSFEAYDGHIRYWIQVDLKRPWKMNQMYTRGFTVVGNEIVDLNNDAEVLKMPVNTEIQKVFCCGPFKTDPLNLHVQLPLTGYVPGQLIPVSVLVTNDTKVPVDEICLRLVMMVSLYSTSPYQRSKTETMTVAKLKGDPVARHCKKHFNYLLPIPATPPTCFNLCAIIQIAYRVEVEAKMKGVMYTNQCIHTPVTIGNVPLQLDGVVIQQQPMAREFNGDAGNATQNTMEVMAIPGSSMAENNNDLTANNFNQQPWSAAGNIPAPVYMEASFMPQGKLSDDSAHDYGEKNFTPKYPVFNIPSPTSTSPKTDEVDGHPIPETDPKKTTWL